MPNDLDREGRFRWRTVAVVLWFAEKPLRVFPHDVAPEVEVCGLDGLADARWLEDAGGHDVEHPARHSDAASVAVVEDEGKGRPIHDQKWSDMFKSWCAGAGWSREATFHSLRLFFATMLIAAGADPTEVQRALRHKLLRTTLETYVHWWPRKQRLRNVVSGALQRVVDGMMSTQDQS